MGVRIVRPERKIYHIPGLGIQTIEARASGAADELTLYATTTATSETVTISRMTPVGQNITIYWGDGDSVVQAPGDLAAESHVYAAAGTYQITVSPASAIQQIDVRDAKLSGLQSSQLAASPISQFVASALGGAVANIINSADMAAWRPSDWRLYSMSAGNYTINSADMAAWRPSQWHLYSMPAGGTYTIDSADMAAWRPSYWWLYSMPAGGTYTIDSADMAAWRPTQWYLYSMPAGNYTIYSADMAAWRPSNWRLYSMPAGDYTIDSADMVAWRPANWFLYSIAGGGAAWTLTAADFAGWTGCTYLQIQNNVLLSTQVDAVLYGMYQATLARTVNGGTLNVGGTNAAPSGVYQPATSCPVGAATPGKEVAHELKNDGCDAIAEGKTWSTVDFTA